MFFVDYLLQRGKKNEIEKAANLKLHVNGKQRSNGSSFNSHAINKIPKTAFCIFILVFFYNPTTFSTFFPVNLFALNALLHDT